MRQRLWITFGIIVLLSAAAGYLSWPSVERLNWLNYRDVSLRKGLDLAGGASLVYEADTTGIDSGQVRNAMNGVRNVMESRINGLGVTEPEIRLTSVGDKPAISVELPGVSDVSAAKNIIGSTAKLEFKDSQGNLILEGKDLVPNGATAAPQQAADGTAALNTQAWQVNIRMNSEGRQKFAQATTVAAPTRDTIGIYLDDVLISNPSVNTPITDGEAVITGSFDAEQARNFALQLNYGALPVPVTLVSESTVGASLGDDAIGKSLLAGIIGIGLLFLYIIAYYRLAGVIAVLALSVYALFNIALYKLLPITMTLAGIAGFIISMGIAVDTNILTFERFKEELRMGKPLPVAVQESFRRAWTSIRDSHVAGIISALIIFLFASGSVRGFAVVLLIGTLLSLFTAITIVRNWMLLLAGSRFGKYLTRF